MLVKFTQIANDPNQNESEGHLKSGSTVHDDVMHFGLLATRHIQQGCTLEQVS